MTAVEEPAELQARNRKTVQEHLEQAYTAVDGLIRKSYSRHDMEATSLLRDLRSNINNLLPEIRSSGLDTFHSRKGNLDDFYASEKRFIESSERFYQTVTSSSEDVDVFKLQQLLTAIQRNLRERIPVSDDVVKEFKIRAGISVVSEPVKETSATVKAFGICREVPTNAETSSCHSTMGVFGIHRETPIDTGTSPTGQSMGIPMGSSSYNVTIEPDGRELPPHLLASLYSYFNLLEQKYSTNHPEISANDVYIGDKKWEFEKGERYIRGYLYDSLFSKTITFYTVFKPFESLKQIAEFMQKEADRVPSGQYLSLCVVGVEWPEDIIKWAASFFHLRMSLFIYDLATGSFCFNKELKQSDRFAFWHNMDKETFKLYDQLLEILEQYGAISIVEASKELGMEQKSTAEYFKKLLKAGALVDVGFGEHKYALSISASKKD